MGKPQGDGLPEPTYYEREVNGETTQRPAYTATDHVNLQAHGWTKVDGETATERPAEAEKRAGSHKRATAQVSVHAQGAAPVDGQGNA